MEMMRIGLDLAKNVFEVFGVDQKEQPVLRKTLKRSSVVSFFAEIEPCSWLLRVEKTLTIGHASSARWVMRYG